MAGDDLITEETFFGGADAVALTISGLPLTKYSSRIQHLHSYGFAGVVVKLPDATGMNVGGPWFYIVNETGIGWDIRDGDSAIILTAANFPDGSAALFMLTDNSTSAGTWISKVMTIN